MDSAQHKWFWLVCWVGVAVVRVQPAHGEDSWPFLGRTSTRVGNTSNLGPLTPRIAWRIEIPEQVADTACPVMDEQGRVFVPHFAGLLAIDTQARRIGWNFRGGGINSNAPALWRSYVLFGGTQQVEAFFCLDARSGQVVWRQDGQGLSPPPVVSDFGIVYFRSQLKKVYARRVEDGSLVWDAELWNSGRVAPSLDFPRLLVTDEWTSLIGLRPVDGARLFLSNVGTTTQGVVSIYNDRIIHASADWYVYCFDASTGARIWRSQKLSVMLGTAAIGHDGTIYALRSGVPRLVALRLEDGAILWEVPFYRVAYRPPTVDGRGTIYFCAQHQTDGKSYGNVYAVRPDGTLLWQREFPRYCSSTPIIASDGTMYVLIGDYVSGPAYLYAFKDPPRPEMPAEPQTDITGRPGGGGNHDLQRWRAELYEQWLSEDWGDAEPVDPPDAYLEMLEPQAP